MKKKKIIVRDDKMAELLMWVWLIVSYYTGICFDRLLGYLTRLFIWSKLHNVE
jgi:hypothetical protein